MYFFLIHIYTNLGTVPDKLLQVPDNFLEVTFDTINISINETYDSAQVRS